MRGACSLLIRWICSLALIVAAMPVKASGMPCVAPETVPIAAHKADCGMPCCEGGHDGAKMACEQHGPEMPELCKAHVAGAFQSAGGRHELTKADASCKCEIKSVPSSPAGIEGVVVPTVHLDGLIAVLPADLPELPVATLVAEPGIFGVDSGPPASVDRPADRGRAPPVA